MDMSPVHQVWPKLSCKAQWKGEEDKAGRGRGEKTTSVNGQAWSSPSPRRQWKTAGKERNWLWNNLWWPNNPRGKGIDDDDDDDGSIPWNELEHWFSSDTLHSLMAPKAFRSHTLVTASAGGRNWGRNCTFFFSFFKFYYLIRGRSNVISTSLSTTIIFTRSF